MLPFLNGVYQQRGRVHGHGACACVVVPNDFETLNCDFSLVCVCLFPLTVAIAI